MVGTTVLRELTGWLHVLLSLAGVIVCALHLGRSRWIWALMGGFGLEAATSVFYRAAMLVMGRGGMSPTSLGAAFFFASVVGLLGQAAIVGGLAGLLFEGRPGSRGSRTEP